MKIKLLKLINNERINKKHVSSKACEGDATAVDICHENDYANCTTYAYDECIKEDLRPCKDGADDICTYDYTICSGPGVHDECYEDWSKN